MMSRETAFFGEGPEPSWLSELVRGFRNELARRHGLARRLQGARVGPLSLLAWSRRNLPQHFAKPPSRMHRWLGARLDAIARCRGVKLKSLYPKLTAIPSVHRRSAIPGRTMRASDALNSDEIAWSKFRQIATEGDRMKSLDKTATRIFRQIIEGLAKLGDHRKLDNAPGSYLALSVEIVGTTPQGSIVALAHYFEQQGDLMADPDMTFLVSAIRGGDTHVQTDIHLDEPPRVQERLPIHREVEPKPPRRPVDDPCDRGQKEYEARARRWREFPRGVLMEPNPDGRRGVE
jgi:hypothetical protein